jgi:hypothetical protein
MSLKIMHMQRIYLACASVLVVALIALSFASKSAAQSADEIQKYINAWLTEYQPQIEAVQTQYLKDTGVYWQGLATHSELAKPAYSESDKTQPITDKEFAADCLQCKPTDRLSEPSWNDLFPNVVDKLPAELSIDVYEGPSGQGYVINLSYCVEQVCYRKSAQVGPEVWRLTDWTEEKAEIK